MKKQSEVLGAAINRLMGLAEVNREYMDADDYGDLQATIRELVLMKHEHEYTEYKDQLKSFVDYLGSGGNSGDDDEKWNAWVDADYVITHRDQTVTVYNGADFCDGLYNLLKETLDDCI